MLKQKKSAVFGRFFLACALPFLLGKTVFAGEIPQLEYRVLRTLPHDENHFTQGLVMRKQRLFESAGGYGRSGLYEKDPASGTARRAAALPGAVFAEGLTLLGEELFLLSWRNGQAYVFDTALKPRRSLRYAGEGWGLTDDGRHLIMSDGSDTLRWRDPAQGAVVRELRVRAGTTPVTALNELEYARGMVFANIWHSDRIAVIHPQDGQVRAWLNLEALRKGLRKPPGWDEQEHVLNGIAHDAKLDQFYITGKCWPTLFVLDVAPLPAPR